MAALTDVRPEVVGLAFLPEIVPPPTTAGITRLDAAAGTGRRARIRRRRALSEVRCHQGAPCLVGRPRPGADHLVIEWPGVDDRFLALVVATTLEWDLVPTVLGTAGPGSARALGPDVVESSGAAALARTLARRLGRRPEPEWDVRIGRDPIAAVVAHVRALRPGLVTLPHEPHGGGHRCPAADLASRLDVPVLLA